MALNKKRKMAMRHHIIEKVDKELAKGIDSEAQAVYFLVEIRKIIGEHDKNFDRYPTIHFFSNWVVHTKLEHATAKKMLAYTECFYAGLDPYLQIAKQTTFYPFVMFIVLRRELHIFLRENDLSEELVLNQSFWERFTYLVLGVVMDCPIEANGFPRLKKFSFTNYTSEDRIECEVQYTSGDVQLFVSKNKWDFIEKDYKDWLAK